MTIIGDSAPCDGMLAGPERSGDSDHHRLCRRGSAFERKSKRRCAGGQDLYARQPDLIAELKRQRGRRSDGRSLRWRGAGEGRVRECGLREDEG